MKGSIVALFMVGVLCAPAFVSADTVMRSGDDISVAPDQTVEGNYYVSVFMGQTTMSGVVERDMVAIGSTVTINGEVKEDLHVAGGNVQVHGTTGGDVRILGGEVTIAENVGGDIVVIGGTLTLLPTAEVTGDVFFFGGSGEIQGTIGGSVYGSAERFSINATVAKDVDVKAAAGTELGERARIGGDVRYTSPLDLARNPSATVTGEVVHNKEAQPDARAQARTLLVPFLILLFTTLALYLIFKRELESMVSTTFTRYGASAFVGMGVFLLGPIFAIILIVTVLGSVVGFMSLMVVATLVLAGLAAAPIFAGALLARMLGRGFEVSLLSIIAGTCVLYGLLFIPALGVLVFVALSILAIGGISLSIYRAIA